MKADWVAICQSEILNVVPDSIVGPKTLAAVAALECDEDLRRIIRAMLLPNGEELTMKKMPMHQAPSLINTVLKMVSKVQPLAGWEDTFLKRVLELENYQRDGHYVIKPNGNHRGLAQFDRASWQTAMPGIPYAKADDPLYALLGAVSYAYINLNILRKKSVAEPVMHLLPDTLYLAHNQGAYKVVRMILRGEGLHGKQSLAAQSLWMRWKRALA